MVRRVLVIATAVWLSIAGISLAQTVDGIKRQAQAEIARWELQKTAAYRDVELTKDVYKAFYTATELADGPPSPANVNAALRPLRERFPDYRLNYRSDADYCPIVRAIEDAQGAASMRAQRALEMQQKILLIMQLHGAMVELRLVGEISGQKPQTSDIDLIFIREVVASKDETISTAWGEEDYLRTAFADRDCR